MRAHRFSRIQQQVRGPKRTLAIAGFVLFLVLVVTLTERQNALVVHSKRVSEPWTCDVQVDTHDESDTVYYPTRTVERAISSTPVTFLEWGDTPGQLCNRLALLAAVHAKMRKSHRLHTFLALNGPFSEVAWTLDLHALSSRVPGVLLDCVICAPDPDKRRVLNCNHGLAPPFIPKQLRCNFLAMKGKVYALENRLFEVDQSYKSDELWWSDRTKIVGFLGEHVQVLQPKPYLKTIIQVIMDRYRAELGEDVRVLAVHRRFMDKYCYAWVNDIRAHQCFPSDELVKLVSRIGPLLGAKWETDSYLYMNNTYRSWLETRNHLLMGCNYTLSASQTNILRSRWPEIFQNPLAVLLATDSQDPTGDAVISKSRLPVKVRTLAEMEQPTCFSGKKYHYMLAEMIAMSLADFHMENSMSSCGDIVAHWRQSLGKPKGSSFPQICYNGFYDSFTKAYFSS